MPFVTARERYVFTGVCLSTGGCLPHPPGQTLSQAGTPLPCRHPLCKPLCPVHAGIWSTSGRYVSHWNAFLLSFAFCCLGQPRQSSQTLASKWWSHYVAYITGNITSLFSLNTYCNKMSVMGEGTG